MHKIMTVIIMITTILVIMFVSAKSVLSAPYLIPPDPKVLMVMEMKPGCRSGRIPPAPPACIGAMKSLNRSFLYYDSNRKLKRKLKLVWTYK